MVTILSPPFPASTLTFRQPKPNRFRRTATYLVWPTLRCSLDTRWPNFKPPTIKQHSANHEPTLRKPKPKVCQPSPNIAPILPNIVPICPSPNIVPTITQLYANHEPTKNQLNYNVLPTIISQRCTNKPTLYQPQAYMVSSATANDQLVGKINTSSTPLRRPHKLQH